MRGGNKEFVLTSADLSTLTLAIYAPHGATPLSPMSVPAAQHSVPSAGLAAPLDVCSHPQGWHSSGSASKRKIKTNHELFSTHEGISKVLENIQFSIIKKRTTKQNQR